MWGITARDGVWGEIKEQLVESILSIDHVAFRGGAQVIILGEKHLQNYLISPL